MTPVATRYGTTLEYIEDGRAGFLCDGEDDSVEALRIIHDPRICERIDGAARQEVEWASGLFGALRKGSGGLIVLDHREIIATAYARSSTAIRG